MEHYCSLEERVGVSSLHGTGLHYSNIISLIYVYFAVNVNYCLGALTANEIHDVCDSTLELCIHVQRVIFNFHHLMIMCKYNNYNYTKSLTFQYFLNPAFLPIFKSVDYVNYDYVTWWYWKLWRIVLIYYLYCTRKRKLLNWNVFKTEICSQHQRKKKNKHTIVYYCMSV